MEETSVLIERARAGDKEAREVLIDKNLGLVRHVAKRFLGRGVDMEDLFQIGVIGLMQAVDRFDLTLGLKFSTYAVPMIMGEIRRYLRDDGPMKVSRSIRENSLKLSRAREKLSGELGREPRLEELAAQAGLTREEAVMALESDMALESLDAGKENDDGTVLSLGERVVFDDAAGGVCASLNPRARDPEKERLLDRMLLKQLWDGLSGEEQRILWLRFFRDKTQTEISKELGISQVQVSRKEKKILEKMRQSANS